MTAGPEPRPTGPGEVRPPHYVLRLYTAGTTPRSAYAIANVRMICEEHLQGRYELEVIDLSQRPDLAQSEQIIAAPTLIKHLPPPLRRFFGDMSNTRSILIGLDLRDAAARLAEDRPS